MRLSTPISLLVLILFSLAANAQEIFSYSVKNRSPDELVKIANSLFQGRANFVESQGRILISTDAKTATKAIELLQQLDQKLKTYRIQFRLKSNERAEGKNISVGAETGGKGWKASLPNQGSSKSGKIQVGGVSVSAEQKDQIRNSHSIQTLVLTGSGEGRLVMDELEMGTFFIVKLSATSSNSVILDIRQGGRTGLRVAGLNTQVTVPLAKWTSLGQVQVGSQGSQSSYGATKSNSGNAVRQLEVQVEEFKEG